jgi:glycosyltransferase involved in cell wall biosynthesis
MSGLRVLHVIGGGDTGGAMSYLLPLLTALRAEGCDADLLCLGGGGLAEAAATRGLPCEVLPMTNPWDPRVLPALRRRLTAGWDVAHTHGMRANLPVRTILRVTPGRPALFTTIHSDLALDYSRALMSRAYVALDRVSAGVVDGFCCVSGDLARRLVARGVASARVRVIYAGLEAPVQDAAAAPPVDAAPGAESRGSTPEIVGTVARLVAVKDIDLLLETAAILRTRRPQVRVVVVGDGPERPALERRAAEMGLEDVVEFRGEVRPAWPALRGFQVYALTSVSEGVPLSVLEAMAVGLPVVAAAVGGIPEIVEEGVTGFLVARCDDRAATAAALAARLEVLLSDPEVRQRMGAAARRRATQTFSTAAAARGTLRFYERVLAQRSENGGW